MNHYFLILLFTKNRKIKLPFEGETESHPPAISENLPDRPGSSIRKQEVQVDDAAIAGLIGEEAEDFEAVFDDTTRRVVPVSHCWTPGGDLYCGCSGGQLLRVDTETHGVKVQ